MQQQKKILAKVLRLPCLYMVDMSSKLVVCVYSISSWLKSRCVLQNGLMHRWKAACVRWNTAKRAGWRSWCCCYKPCEFLRISVHWVWKTLFPGSYSLSLALPRFLPSLLWWLLSLEKRGFNIDVPFQAEDPKVSCSLQTLVRQNPSIEAGSVHEVSALAEQLLPSGSCWEKESPILMAWAPGSLAMLQWMATCLGHMGSTNWTWCMFLFCFVLKRTQEFRE